MPGTMALFEAQPRRLCWTFCQIFCSSRILKRWHAPWSGCRAGARSSGTWSSMERWPKKKHVAGGMGISWGELRWLGIYMDIYGFIRDLYGFITRRMNLRQISCCFIPWIVTANYKLDDVHGESWGCRTGVTTGRGRAGTLLSVGEKRGFYQQIWVLTRK